MDPFEAIERNWKNGDTRSAEWLLIQEVKRLRDKLDPLPKEKDG